MSKLKALHDLLLDQSKWPDDFVWDYNDCTTCAIGLAYRAGLISIRPYDAQACDFGLDYMTGHAVFYTPERGTYDGVTPEIVAARIANLL